MRVLHVNIRLSEGGAARVARELHCGLLEIGVQSDYAYGYSRRGLVSPIESKIPGAFRVSHPIQSATNRGLHRLIGIDPIQPFGIGCQRLIECINDCDIVHFHAIHSHYIPYQWVFEKILNKSKPVVWTAHDHWMLTGRCAFTDGCNEWLNECGNCLTKNNYPPTFFDFSKSELMRKKRSVASILSNTVVVSPSLHLASDIERIYPESNLRVIPNSIDSEIEKLISSSCNLEFRRSTSKLRPRILVIANDLSYDGKTSRHDVGKLIESKVCDIVTVGIKSPFFADNVENLGEIVSRVDLLKVYESSDAIFFSSKVDNFPLVLCEAQSAGVPVFATPSPAATEVLGMLGGKCMDLTSIVEAINSRNLFSQYGHISDSAGLRQAALLKFGFKSMLESYLNIYSEVLRGA